MPNDSRYWSEWDIQHPQISGAPGFYEVLGKKDPLKKDEREMSASEKAISTIVFCTACIKPKGECTCGQWDRSLVDNVHDPNSK